MSRRQWDAPTVAMHAVALVVWPFALGWTVFRLLSDRFPAGGTAPNPDRRRTP